MSESDIYHKFSLKGRIWIEVDENSFVGQGKIELLEKIKSLGSLRKAALDMKMSYRQAWLNINTMNSFSDQKVVILRQGGKDGGTATITDFGEALLRNYHAIQAAFEQFLEDQTGKMTL
jgi:molybdate transport system regulatory protein